MSSRKRNWTDDEIEQQTLASLNDPDAWEAPVYVKPVSSERPAWVTASRHLELAAKHYIVSLLHRVGAEANVTMMDTAGVDITVVLPSGQTITMEVKTLTRTRKWTISQFACRPHHYVAFVVYSRPSQPVDPPQVAFVGSERLQSLVAQWDENVLPLKALGRNVELPIMWEQILRESAA